jgi:hypothetical protein
MSEKLLLNQEPYVISENNLPCLVTYGEHMGGSHLSIALVANLFLSGSKILFLTAYPMARENFLEQIGTNHSGIAFVDSIPELEKALSAQAIILKSGDENLFIEAVKVLPDLHERVVLIKNMEVFGETVFDVSLSLEKIILSGNIDACISKGKIVKKNFSTIIVFNQPEIKIGFNVPPLEKYTGFLFSDAKKGVLSIKKS